MKNITAKILPAIASLTFVITSAATPVLAANYLDRKEWKWTVSSNCSPEGDITGVEGLYDGDVNTCWHSNYHAESGSAERINPHWIMIDRGTDTSPFDGLAYTPRQLTSNTSCTSYYVYLRDNDLSNTPSNSASAIVQRLGSPDAEGSWDGTSEEQFVQFEKTSNARYILFVNLTSASSNSAACAEMNLFSGSGTPSQKAYNAIKITPADSSEPHRIAINGSRLTMSMNFGYIRMSNSDITIEYAPSEVERFNFEHYDFNDGSLYAGTKKDVLTSRFNLNVLPRQGQCEAFNSVTLSAEGGLETRVNPAVTEPIRFYSGSNPVLTVMPSELGALASGTDYVITGVGAETDGNYSMTIPAELFIEPDGARSEAAEINWTVNLSAIESVKANDDCPTLTLSHNNGRLTVGGITGADSVNLISTSGAVVMTAKVTSGGTATLTVGSLARGVYLLNVNNTTLKIIL